jgi:hypothetical protein
MMVPLLTYAAAEQLFKARAASATDQEFALVLRQLRHDPLNHSAFGPGVNLCL